MIIACVVKRPRIRRAAEARRVPAGDVCLTIPYDDMGVQVPGNTTLQLSFTPAFEQAASLLRGSATHNPKASADLPTGQDGLMVPVVFTARGRDAILNSTCGRYNATTRSVLGS